MSDGEHNFKFFKLKWFPWATAGLICVIALVVVYISSYNVGYAAKKAMIDGKMNTYQQLLKKIDDTKKQISTQQFKLDTVNGKLSSNKDEFDRLTALENRKNQLKSNVSDSISQIADLNGQIKTAKAKLAKLQGGIQKAKGKSISLGAGKFTVGDDIPAGRYKVVPIGRGSNFFVYDGVTGVTKVNTILGTSIGVPSYVVHLNPLDKIDSETPAKFIPVK